VDGGSWRAVVSSHKDREYNIHTRVTIIHNSHATRTHARKWMVSKFDCMHACIQIHATYVRTPSIHPMPMERERERERGERDGGTQGGRETARADDEGWKEGRKERLNE